MLDYIKDKLKVLQSNKERWDNRKNKEDQTNTDKQTKRNNIANKFKEEIKNSEKRFFIIFNTFIE